MKQQIHQISIVLAIIVALPSAAAFNASIILVRPEKNDLVKDVLDKVLLDLAKDENIDLTEADVKHVTARGKIPKNILDPLCEAVGESIQEKKPPLVLDVTHAGVPSETVKSFSLALALPTVATSYGQEGDLKSWLALDEDEEKYLIQICPPSDIITEIIKAIVKFQNITNFAVLYDENYYMSHKIADFTQTMTVRSIMKQIAPGDMKNQIKELNNLDYHNYFVMGSVSTIEEILGTAHDLNFLKKPGYSWYAGTLESGEISCDCEGKIIALQPKADPDAGERLNTLFEDGLLDPKEKVNAAFYYDVFAKAILGVRDLIKEGAWPDAANFVDCENFSEEKMASNAGVDLRSAMQKVPRHWTYSQWDLSSNGKSFMAFNVVLQSLVLPHKKKDSDEVELGSWRAGLDSPIRVTKPEGLASKSSRPSYRVVTNVQPPFVMKNLSSKGPPFYGLCIDLIEELAKKMGFVYKIYEVSDKQMGYIDDNGDWSGIVGELIAKKADIGLASISVMPERERVIDFTIPYYDLVGISILMKKAQTPTSLFKFLTVLETDVWLCILAAYFITSILMWIFDRYSPYSYQNNKEKYKDDEEKRIFDLKECLWFCMTSLTPQGGGEAPKNLSGRLVAATWWLFGFIIMASYTANLAAFLTVSRLDTPIESLDDLSKQYKINYAPINGSSEMRYFQRMAEIEDRFYNIWKDMSLNDSLSPYERSKLAVWDYPVSDKFTKMWQAMKEAVLPIDMDDAIDRIQKSKSSSEGFALLGDGTDNEYYYQTTCDLHVVGEQFSRKPYAIALQEGSPLRHTFNNALQELINNKTLTELKIKWWAAIKKRDDCVELNEESEGISIKNIGGVFIVILLGIGGALFALSLEYGWHQFQRSRTAPTIQTPGQGWNSSNDREGGFPNRPDEGNTNRYLDPLNLYGDHIMRRNNVQRAFSNYPW